MADSKESVRAALIIIGNEILSGRTKDANLPHIAETLNSVGVTLSEARVIPDIETEIIETVNTLRQKFDYVFTTGGIGPTHDDITSECVAKAFGQRLIRNPDALRLLQTRYADTGLELTEARLRMANTPEHAELIANPISAAPGFRVENVFVMAGVPKIMQAMLDNVKGELKGGLPTLSRSVLCNLGEGTIAKGLGDIQQRYADVDIGSYPRFGGEAFRVTLIIRHSDDELLQQVQQDIADLITSLGGEARLDADE